MVKLDLFTHYSLQDLNTLGVPAIAGNYVKVESVDEVKQALKLAKDLELPVIVLGGGSNVVLPDMFVGLVIHIAITGTHVVAEDDDHVWLKIGAGENWHSLVEHCLHFHYWGIENLALIPGTVGAAPIQNIGAYGVELESVFSELSTVERQSQIEVTFDRDGCEFGYRDSIFKNKLRNRYVITSITLRLNKHPSLQLHYPALREAIEKKNLERITPEIVANTVCEIRRSKLPDPAQIPNAGSFFKNPIISVQEAQRLRQKFPGLVSFATEDGREKIAAAWLIDQAGWKGKEEYGVGVHKDQALVVINPGNKSGQQIVNFAKKIKDHIQQLFDIELQMEPEAFGKEQ
jgi:UDP-N-acetylmuramate dehydrogenase